MKTRTDTENRALHPELLFADRLGNLYDAEENLVQPSPFADSISDMQFWCVRCKEIKEVSTGVVAGKDIGGYACLFHEGQSNQ